MSKEKVSVTSQAEQKNKKKSQFLRISVLVLVFCVAVVGALVISDLFFADDAKTQNEPELVAVSVMGEKLVLNSGDEVTVSELRDYMNNLKAQGKTFVGSIINDMADPADAKVYNQVVDLFAEFDIICEKLPLSASADEENVATSDEV